MTYPVGLIDHDSLTQLTTHDGRSPIRPSRFVFTTFFVSALEFLIAARIDVEKLLFSLMETFVVALHV